jgi:hypothetical protein
VGCEWGKGKVSGRVLFRGAPLPGGRLTFRPADPRLNSVSAELDEQGNYQAVLPVGEVKVSIDNRELEPAAPREIGVPGNLPPQVRTMLLNAKADRPPPKPRDNAPAKSSALYRKIPRRYYDAETSGLQFTVQSGAQLHDIELDK